MADASATCGLSVRGKARAAAIRGALSCAIAATSCLSAIATRSILAQTLFDPSAEVENVVTTGLAQPTGLAFLNDSDATRFFIIEKASGQVKLVQNGAVASTVLDLPVNAQSERGLLGIALHPSFAINGFVYLYYSRADSDGASWLENRVSRFTWDGAALTGETPIVSFPFDANQANGPNHDGGIIRFGPDGKLYGITGDLNRFRLEQNQSDTLVSGVGGVFRLNDDGSIPADNPFIAHPEPAIQRLFAYGVRNSFGLVFDPQTGNLWDTENGPNAYDEVNLVPEGFNSGWSQIMGPDSRDPQDAADLVHLSGSVYLDPKLSFFNPVAVTAILFVDGAEMPPPWHNTVLTGDANFGNLYRFTLNAARDTLILSGDVADLVADDADERNSLRVGAGFGPITDLDMGPDGLVYITSLSGTVRRLVPVVPVPGDLNCDESVDLADVQPFALALTDASAYAAAHPDCTILNADTNADFVFDGRDVPGFVQLLLAP